MKIIFENHSCNWLPEIVGIVNYLKHYWAYHWLMPKRIHEIPYTLRLKKHVKWGFENAH